MKIFVCCLVLFFVAGFSAAAGKAASPKASPLPSKKIVAAPDKDDEKVDLKPGELQKQVLATVKSLDSAKTSDDRAQVLTALQKKIEAEADNGTIEGVRYSVALEPVFDNRRNLNEKKICQDTREDILHRFTSGSGNNGKIPYFVKDALQILAAACQDDSLTDE
jgi:hypothetical protein